ERDGGKSNMRCLLAAKALAAALVLVPIHAGLESAAFAVEIESDVTAASTTAARSAEAQQDAALDAVKPAPSAGFSGSGADSNADTDAASVPPSSAGTAVLSADAICQALGLSAWKNNLPLNFFTRLIWQESRDRKSVV